MNSIQINMQNQKKYSDEIEALQKESEMSLDDVLDSLPQQMINRLAALEPEDRDAADENGLSDYEESR